MDNKLKKNMMDIVGGLENKETQKEVNDVKIGDPLFTLKGTLFSFFEKRIDKILQEDEFLSEVKEKILEKIQNDELSIPQLISLYNDISQQSTVATNSILDIFKPSPQGNVSPIVQPTPSDQMGRDFMQEAIGPIDRDTAEALNILSGVLENIKKGKKNTDIVDSCEEDD